MHCNATLDSHLAVFSCDPQPILSRGHRLQIKQTQPAMRNYNLYVWTFVWKLQFCFCFSISKRLYLLIIFFSNIHILKENYKSLEIFENVKVDIFVRTCNTRLCNNAYMKYDRNVRDRNVWPNVYVSWPPSAHLSAIGRRSALEHSHKQHQLFPTIKSERHAPTACEKLLF